MNNDLFTARITDLTVLAEKNSSPQFLGFLSEEESAIANQILSKLNIKYSFFGGFSDAQRKILCCMPDWCDNPIYPIEGVTFSYNNAYTLSHRDFLGALMGIGIKRESVGDILVEDGRAVVFLNSKILSYVLTQVEKVGRVGVTAKLGFDEPLPKSGTLVSLSDTVSSMRLDCIVSAVCKVSRSTAVEYIENAKVLVNSLVVEKPTKLLLSGDTLTVRGIGKFFITSASEHTKKGRIILNYNKYI